MASIQIKGIYYAVSDLKSLYNEIQVGDSVQLKSDPRNTCDDLAIAVYYRYRRIGFVEMSRVVEIIHLIPDGATLSVHIDQVLWNEEEPRRSLITFCIEDAQLESGDYGKCLLDIELKPDVWGYLKPPFLVYDEEGVKILVADYERMMSLCLSMSVRDVERMNSVADVESLTERYMEMLDSSLSGDITLSMNAIRSGLQRFRRTFKVHADRLDAVCQRLDEKQSERAHKLMEIYNRQTEAIRRECERRCGFFYRYSMLYLKTERSNMVALLEQRLGEVKEWLNAIPEDIAGFYFNDKNAFVEKIFYKRVPCISLNRIYLHILLYEYLDKMRKEPLLKELEREQMEQQITNENRVAPIYVNGDLHIHADGGEAILKGDIIENGGVKIIK